jgi:hypothetical protein
MPLTSSTPAARNRLREFVFSRRSRLLFLPILFVVNLLWFYPLGFHTLMGDDLIRWNQVTSFSSVATAFSNIVAGSKYRPVNDLCHYILFALFSHDYRLFLYFNILFNFVIVTALFALIEDVTGNDLVLAFGLSLVYITARFSYYNILQVYGILEALSLLLLLAVIYCVIRFIRTAALKWAIFAAVSYFLLTLNHERYLAILPFLLLAFAFFGRSTGYRRKAALLLIAVSPFLLNLFLKRFVFHVPFITRTSTIPLDLSIFSILEKMGLGQLKILGVNNGPGYLNLIPFPDQDTTVQVVGILIAAFIAVLLFLALRRSAMLQIPERLKEGKRYLLWATLLLVLLFSASIVADQEQRWLYSPFVVVLISISYLLSDFRIGRFSAVKYIVLGVLVALMVHNDIYYRRFLSNLHFVRANLIADSFYNVTVNRYGTNIVDYELFVEKFGDCQWILQDSLFFKPYIPDRKVRITYVDHIEQIKPEDRRSDRSLIYALNPRRLQMLDLKNPDPPVLIRFGPDGIKAGHVFNEQPSGESAIWADTENTSQATVFVLNGIELESTMHADGKFATATVPRQLYEAPGEYTLILFDKKTAKKSNPLRFVVEP